MSDKVRVEKIPYNLCIVRIACPRCGKELNDSWVEERNVSSHMTILRNKYLFCYNCGQKLEYDV